MKQCWAWRWMEVVGTHPFQWLEMEPVGVTCHPFLGACGSIYTTVLHVQLLAPANFTLFWASIKNFHKYLPLSSWSIDRAVMRSLVQEWGHGDGTELDDTCSLGSSQQRRLWAFDWIGQTVSSGTERQYQTTLENLPFELDAVEFHCFRYGWISLA